MSFVSLTFILFLPAVFLLHWLCRSARQQNVVLILASYFFYGWWDWRFCGLMLLSTLIDYTIGLLLGNATGPVRRRLLLFASVAANLTVLGIFKYCNFFLDNFHATLTQLGWNIDQVTLNVVLPVGISFYTFQTLSYTIDVYFGKLRPSRNLIDYLAFVSFFPQLVAGPIERASNLLPQFAKRREFDVGFAGSGLVLILYGVVKKLLLADRLALYVDESFANHEALSGPALGLAVVFFAFQIYCDFSAYSDIARGTARLFSVHLMRNFDFPYFSRSLSEFWRRWHISLSSWFRDYVYIPLGGNRCSPARTRRNLMITFLLSGVWHGAAWTFVFWGFLHGLVLACTRQKVAPEPPGEEATIGQQLLYRARTGWAIASTFAIVCLGWVFFRAESMGQAFNIIWRMTVDVANVAAYQALVAKIDGDKLLERSVILLTLFVIFEWIQRRRENPLESLRRAPLVLRWSAYTVLIWGTLYLLPNEGTQQFIYFDF